MWNICTMVLSIINKICSIQTVNAILANQSVINYSINTRHMTSNGLISLTRLLHHLCINICVFTYLKEQEGILRVHACIRWTTIAWAHQIWWRQIGNSRKVSVLLKAISSVLWIPTFLQKMFSMTKIGRFLRGFSVVDFSAVGFLDLLKTLKTQRHGKITFPV